MNTKPAMSNDWESGTAFGHAIVIGSSIAGLTMARVLTDHFARVTIVERDRLPDTPKFRRSVPQARHAHTLPLRGQMILEQQFPGLTDELVANGTISINGGIDSIVLDYSICYATAELCPRPS
jgi:choline dehydrogenase-like flavoprotein